MKMQAPVEMVIAPVARGEFSPEDAETSEPPECCVHQYALVDWLVLYCALSKYQWLNERTPASWYRQRTHSDTLDCMISHAMITRNRPIRASG